MTMSAKRRSNFATLHRQWWCHHEWKIIESDEKTQNMQTNGCIITCITCNIYLIGSVAALDLLTGFMEIFSTPHKCALIDIL